jgi:hypothetical protein
VAAKVERTQRRTGVAHVEFVSYDEAMDVLREYGVREVRHGEERIGLELEGNGDVVHLHLTSGTSAALPRVGATVLKVEKDRFPGVIEHIMHKLHLRQVLLIPVSRWRKVFDAVAFSMASNEDWQEIDATATVEQNTRDPLLCEPGDFQTLKALINALLNDAEAPDQGLMVTTTGAPLMVELVPDGAVRISVGNPVLADELAQVFAATRS